jgi:hypothetical protein
MFAIFSAQKRQTNVKNSTRKNNKNDKYRHPMAEASGNLFI